MQKLGDTIITDLGMDLLSSVNNGDDKITYTKTVLAADDLTQESDVDIQKTTSLTLIQQTTGTTVISRVDDTVNLGATFTNKEVTQDFDFYVIGWYAKGSAVITDERLFAITPSTVKQTMPAGKDGAATAAISPKYASALSRSATVSLNPDQAGTVTPEYVDQKIQQIISEGIVNAGSTLSESDNLDSFITTGYHLIKGSLPLSAPEGFSTNGQIIVYGNKDTTDGVTQLAYDDINGTSYVRSYNPTNNKWSDWDLVITKSQLNAVLPTDIARTGEDNEFKGKNTFDVDPVNKDGNSYGLAKDIDTKVTDNGDNSIEINKQAVTPVRDNKNGSINFNSKDMTPADDSAVVHTTGNETIDGQKKFKTDPTDGAGNAYAKTVDVNQQLDKKVNVSDMRKPASDVAGIEEVNTKQDKIGYTPADDSKVVHNSGNEEISGQKTFDIAPIDKKTGNLYITKADVPKDYSDYTVDLTDAKYDRNKWYYVEADSHQSSSLINLSYFSLEAPLYSGIDVPYGVHTNGLKKDACARQTVLYSPSEWGAYNRKLTVIYDQTRFTTDGKRLLTFAVPSDNNLNYAFYARGGLKINIASDVPGLTWTPHTDTFVENGTTISVLNDAPDPKALGLDDDHTFWALPMSQFNQQLKSYVTQLNSTDMNTVLDAGLYQLISGTNGMPNVDSYALYQVINLNDTNGVQLAYGTNNDILGMRSWNNSNQFTSWVQFADDSKVAHLSGANNFDTVPTVNNNPLLLASSLPSDLARTGSDQEFTGKNTFDTAPIDKTTGNPYITKDGVPSLPSDLARTGQANTFTAAQTFSIAPTIKDASTDKGDNQAATMADLKSVEKSAWHQLDSKYISISDYTDHKGLLLYKINESNKTIDFIYSINGLNSSIKGAHTIQFDFSSIVKGLKYTYQDGDLIGIDGFFDDENNNQNEIRTIVSNVSGAKVSYNFPSTSLTGYGCGWMLITSSLSQSADVASLNYTEILN